MSAPQHRKQQIHRPKHGNRAGEEAQCESDRGNEFDRSGEQNLHCRRLQAEALEIEDVYIELIRAAENVTPEMRDEHQPEIDSDERQCRCVDRSLSGLRRGCGRRGAQNKMEENKGAKKPTDKCETGYTGPCRDLQVQIVSVQSRQAGWRVQTQNAE